MIRGFKAVLLAGALAAVSASGAHAEQGDLLVRLRTIVIAPTNQGDQLLQPATRSGIPTNVDVGEAVVPEVDLTYMVTKNIGLETICCVARHSARITGGPLGGLRNVVHTWVLPATVMLQYHFLPDSTIRPYAGVGVNYTFFINEKASTSLVGAAGPTNVKLKDSFTWAVGAGVDWQFSERFFLNLDVKYIAVDTTATLRTTALGVQAVDIDLRPVVAGIGLGIKF
jgi:outer membrane protein